MVHSTMKLVTFNIYFVSACKPILVCKNLYVHIVTYRYIFAHTEFEDFRNYLFTFSFTLISFFVAEYFNTHAKINFQSQVKITFIGPHSSLFFVIFVSMRNFCFCRNFWWISKIDGTNKKPLKNLQKTPNCVALYGFNLF